MQLLDTRYCVKAPSRTFFQMDKSSRNFKKLNRKRASATSYMSLSKIFLSHSSDINISSFNLLVPSPIKGNFLKNLVLPLYIIYTIFLFCESTFLLLSITTIHQETLFYILKNNFLKFYI